MQMVWSMGPYFFYSFFSGNALHLMSLMRDDEHTHTMLKCCRLPFISSQQALVVVVLVDFTVLIL